MKKYNVEVNGTDYEVIIKDSAVEESTSTSTQPQTEETNTANQAANNTETQSPKTKDTNSEEVNDSGDMVAVEAPMSGTILSIKTNKGEKIEEGETIMTLEAMKMETEISAPVAGEIGAIKVGEGDNCEHGSVIALIKEGL